MIKKPLFFTIFAKSPFKRIEKHMNTVFASVDLLGEFFDSCQAGQWKSAEILCEQISAKESEADQLKKKLRIRLHHGLFLPVPRAELLALLQIQDNIANQAEDIAILMLGRQMVFPDKIQSMVKELLLKSVETCQKAQEVSAELRDLLEAGFEGVILKVLGDMIKDLDALENECDGLQFKIRTELFKIESQHGALDVVFWYECIKQLGDLADWARRVGSQLLILSSR